MLGTMMYANDYDGWVHLPYYSESYKLWYTVMIPEYIPDKLAVYSCPSLPLNKSHSLTKQKWHKYGMKYLKDSNTWLRLGKSSYTLKVGGLYTNIGPSKFIVWGDSVDMHDGDLQSYVLVDNLEGTTATRYNLHLRHNKRANI